MKKADVILILGHRLNPDGSPSDDLKRRIAKAKSLYDAGVAPWIIPCGGRLPGRARSEADVMRDMLIKLGVPDKAILLEGASQITIENIKNAKDIMDKRGMKTAALVTSDYHVGRALQDCLSFGIDAFGAASKTPMGTYWFSVRWKEFRIRRMIARAKRMGKDPHEYAKEIMARRMQKGGGVK
jgi:uncharacterized SAM-binding protein YcdF (DUF218 family)